MATESWQSRLFRPVDAASVVVFRIVFGLLMLIAVGRFFAHGWIAEYFLKPRHFFPHFGFTWVRPWPAMGMYIHFALMGVCALFVTAGLFYRISIALFGLLFAYAHLIDKTNYLNHYYLLICLSGLMAFLPLNCSASLDARRNPVIARSAVPSWVLWALRAQVGLVYFFGGVAKLKWDWLVNAEPLQIWLAANTDFPVVGSLFQYPWVAHAMSIAGAAFDLLIVPLLLWPGSRAWAYGALVAFHLITGRLFQLGMFPWVMMASSLLFFPADWPRSLFRRLGVHGVFTQEPNLTVTPNLVRPTVAWALCAYFTFHALMPLRHFLYPGDVNWSEQGFRFSWNVMLMEKDGSARFHVRDPKTARQWEVSPRQYLTAYQTKMMASQPDMIVDFAHIIADDFRQQGIAQPEVRADVVASLNGRRRARLIDPAVDLARERDGLAAKAWIMPLSAD